MPVRGIQRTDDGTCAMSMNWLWTRVKRWARRHGYQYDYANVQGVAPI